MTVIAYRDGVLAADKLMQNNGLKSSVTKIYRLGDAMVGVAGTFSLALGLVEWLRLGADPHTLPDFQKSASDFQSVIYIRDREIWLYEQGSTPFKVESSYYAIGGGAPYAMAAMWCGKTAAAAVQCASELDTGCGMGMDVLQDDSAKAPATVMRLVK